ncbi:MAG: DNA polymerase III subunit chi [Rhodoferax sp.]|jgi:DNA polymerase-3 subunit chi|nr:DNA polymerase III subunit chi [Rhodoferax sp.]
MTEVAFHFNVPDKWAYVCRLLRKATSKGARVAVIGEPESLAQMDGQLWALSPTDFLPHCDAGADAATLAASPIVFCPSCDQSPHQEVLLNLGPTVPAGFERFERLIEIVGPDDEDRQVSRRRWKFYQDRGYAIARHDLARRETA